MFRAGSLDSTLYMFRFRLSWHSQFWFSPVNALTVLGADHHWAPCGEEWHLIIDVDSHGGRWTSLFYCAWLSLLILSDRGLMTKTLWFDFICFGGGWSLDITMHCVAILSRVYCSESAGALSLDSTTHIFNFNFNSHIFISEWIEDSLIRLNIFSWNGVDWVSLAVIGRSCSTSRCIVLRFLCMFLKDLFCNCDARMSIAIWCGEHRGLSVEKVIRASTNG